MIASALPTGGRSVSTSNFSPAPGPASLATAAARS